MKIREIQAAGLRGATPEGGWGEELRRDDCVHTLIRVVTNEGLNGLGSVYTSDQLVRGALELLEPLCRGESALEPERVSEKLHQNMFWLGRGGSVTHTISGVDMALWDLLGQATGQPVGRLMGGRYRDRVKPYASLLMQEPEPLADRLVQLVEQGFRAFKIGWGPFGRQNHQRDEAIVRAAREAVSADSQLMVDAGASNAFWSHGYKWALRTAQMLGAYDVAWLEEPLKPDAMDDYVRLRQRAPVPIAAGEVLTRRQSFRPWLEAGALDVVQPDVTKVGGLSEQRRIGWMAQDHGLRLIPHGWNTAVGLAADLQLASALPDTDLVEYLTGSAYVDEIVDRPWQLDDDGMLPIPDTPGLGLSLNPEAVAKYTRRGAFDGRPLT
jgi:L-alanine-DL-glutamate epimerase-like enolase superfamily enzyme